MVRRWPRAPDPWTRSLGRDRQRHDPTPCWSGALGRSCTRGGASQRCTCLHRLPQGALAHGRALPHAAAELQADRELVLETVRQDGENCKPTTANSGRQPPAPLCRGRTQGGSQARPGGRAAYGGRIALGRGRAHGGPQARPGGRADGWTRIAICRSRAPGGPRARLGGRAATWAHITACRGRTAGGPRARPGGRAAAWNRIALCR